MSRSSFALLPLFLCVILMSGCEQDSGEAIDRELARARADQVRAEAISKAADRRVAEQHRQHPLPTTADGAPADDADR